MTWKLTSPDFALRFMRVGNDRAVSYPQEQRLFELIRRAGFHVVPEPITGSHRFEVMPAGWKAWALDSWVPGRPWRPSDGFGAWREGGMLLKFLHSIEVSGYGPVHLLEDGSLQGSQRTVSLGTYERWRTTSLWIGQQVESLAHLHSVAPLAVRELVDYSASVRVAALEADSVLVHSDLHSQHVLTDGQMLVGVLDFGGAFRGPAAWEFAAIGVFNGWRAADESISTYDSPDPLTLSRHARLLGLSLGAYRFNVEFAAKRWGEARRLLRGLGRTLAEARAL